MSNTYEEEKPEVEVEDEGQEVIVESTDEVEETTEEKPVEEVKAEETTEEKELEDYSTTVQKRIKQLNDRYRNEQLQREEAVRVAEQLVEENKKLKERVKNLDSGYLTEYGARTESQLEAARRVFKEAYESGDAEAITSAQEALARATAEADRFEVAKKKADEVAVVQQSDAESTPQPKPQQAQPDPKAKAWAEKNQWFGQDEVMTYATFGIHRKLIEEEGFDPNSEEYYSEIDRRLRSEFPNKFQVTKKPGSNQVASAGSSASRSPKQGRKNSVKLSPSQIAIAKKLNVPLEEYAKYVKD